MWLEVVIRLVVRVISQYDLVTGMASGTKLSVRVNSQCGLGVRVLKFGLVVRAKGTSRRLSVRVHSQHDLEVRVPGFGRVVIAHLGL